MQWLRNLNATIRYNEPLARHTSLRVGGRCLAWCQPRSVRALCVCIRQARKHKIPLCVLGAGTNVLIKDTGFPGVVISLQGPPFQKIVFGKQQVWVGGGVLLPRLLSVLQKHNRGGFEFLAGIPGTVGGATVMNAGIASRKIRLSIGDVVRRVKAVDHTGKIIELTRARLAFCYRRSNLDTYVIIGVCLVTKSRTAREIKNRIASFLETRTGQDYSSPNAGSIFKNPSKHISAARLIDQCGLKGRQYGGALVSRKHANFILNFNHASTDDIIHLIHIIKTQVRQRHGIQLKEEIRIVPV